MRKEIEEFGNAMEEGMASHDEERGDEWKSMTLQKLNDRLGEELDELKKADSFKKVKKELVDVANFCMMLHNRLNDGGNQQ